MYPATLAAQLMFYMISNIGTKRRKCMQTGIEMSLCPAAQLHEKVGDAVSTKYLLLLIKCIQQNRSEEFKFGDSEIILPTSSIT